MLGKPFSLFMLPAATPRSDHLKGACSELEPNVFVYPNRSSLRIVGLKASTHDAESTRNRLSMTLGNPEILPVPLRPLPGNDTFIVSSASMKRRDNVEFCDTLALKFARPWSSLKRQGVLMLVSPWLASGRDGLRTLGVGMR